MTNHVRFWGVRGSIPSPGLPMTTCGGNTACVEVNLGSQRIILDGGTGLRALGLSQGGSPLDAWLLFGHLHWDHIQGVPFCAPLFDPKSRVRMVGPVGLRMALHAQMSRPSFPITLETLAAQLSFTELQPGERLGLDDVELRTAPLRHPGGGLAYALIHEETKVVYACDTEHPTEGPDPSLVELCRGADLVIYDAQYLPEEYPNRIGWGHSTFVAGVELARASGAARLVLTHHDPNRDDLAVARLERQAQALLPGTRAAREGDLLEIRGRSEENGRLVPAAAGT